MASVVIVPQILLPEEPDSQFFVPPERQGLNNRKVDGFPDWWKQKIKSFDFRILGKYFDRQFGKIWIFVFIDCNFAIFFDEYFGSDLVQHLPLFFIKIRYYTITNKITNVQP